MTVVLPLVLDGQKLTKGVGFPKTVASGSKQFLELQLSGVPDGVIAKAYFKQSWDVEKNVYDVDFYNGSLIVPEFITTLPEETNEYVDYVVSVSVTLVGNDGERGNTNPVDIVLEKSNYSSETTNTPDLPPSQYEQLVGDVINSIVVDEGLDISSKNPVQNKVVSEQFTLFNDRVLNLENNVGNIKTDDKLDLNSTNPVQNKAVTLEISMLQTKDAALQDTVDGLNATVADVEGQVSKLIGDSVNTGQRVGALETASTETNRRIYNVEEYINKGITPKVDSAILYTEQTLTEEQKAQARANIGAVAEDETFDRAIGEVIVGKNLFNPNAVAPDPNDPNSGGFWRNVQFLDTGETKSSSGACITDFIPVQQGVNIYFSSSADGSWGTCDARRVMGYDEDKNFVKAVRTTAKAYVTAEEVEGVAYIRVQFTTANADAECQVEYEHRTTYEPYTETVVPGGITLKPECLPAEFGELKERVTELENNNGTGGVVDTLAIDKARFDDRFNYIAYSEINGRAAPNNTLSHFQYCVKQGFTGLKGDMRITSDGKLVMCHDAGFTLDENGDITTFNKNNVSVVIRNMTEAECFALKHAGRTDSVCSFETYIGLCKKYGKIAYITIREEYVDEVVPEMMRILRKYSMVKQCIVSGYPSNAPLQTVRAADPNVMLAWVLAQNVDITTDHIDYAVSMGNMLICGFHFSSASNDVPTKLAGSLAAIEYAHEKDIRVYEAQVCSMEQADQLMEYGVTGAQMRVAPTFE